jgi:hypothetical protein
MFSRTVISSRRIVNEGSNIKNNSAGVVNTSAGSYLIVALLDVHFFFSFYCCA